MNHVRIFAALLLLLGVTGFTPLTYGVFRNETSRNVPLILFAAREPLKNWKSLTVHAHATLRVPVFNGVAIITSPSGEPISRCSLMPVERLHRYYDFQNRSYYYRITHTSIQPVLPQDARGWNGQTPNQAMQRTAGRSAF